MEIFGGYLAANIRTQQNIDPDRVILHSDLNNFYASVECMKNPRLRDKPVAVCGMESERHGIVLAKNYHAKKYNIQTAETIWQARKKCPDLVVVPPHYDEYARFSAVVKDIYREYSPRVESFGPDECWLDLSGCEGLFGEGKETAEKIRSRIKKEVGLTVSVGVSFNKVFSKLGSDMKKPDAVTAIPYQTFREQLWSLSVNELLFVGKSTYKSLSKYGIFTIGDLAGSDMEFLKRILGKNGETLWYFANGMDCSPVKEDVFVMPAKSIGNSMTTIRDICNKEELKIIIYRLADKVAARLRADNLYCKTVQLHIRDKELEVHEYQKQLEFPACTMDVLAEAAMELYLAHPSEKPLRSVGIRTSGLVQNEFLQFSLFPEVAKAQKMQLIETEIDGLRKKYGENCVYKGIFMSESPMNYGAIQGVM